MKQSVISEMRLTNRTCKLCIGNATQPHLSARCLFFCLFLFFSSENYFHFKLCLHNQGHYSESTHKNMETFDTGFSQGKENKTKQKKKNIKYV